MKRDTVREQDRLDARMLKGTLWCGGRLMSLRKHRSVNDVPASAVMEKNDPAAALRMAFSLSELALRLARWRPPSGVHKSRSLAEAQVLRQAWERGS